MMENTNINPELFTPIPKDTEASELIARPSLTFWQDVWMRLKSNKVAMGALIMLIVLSVMSIIGPYFNKYQFNYMDSKLKDITPNSTFWFGTDVAGRDIFTRVWVAGRASLLIGLTGALISTTVGVVYGAIAGFAGGKTDLIMMRIVEILSSLPYLLVVILVQIRLNDRSLGSMLIALTIVAWTGTARLIRAEVLKLKNQEFIMAARALGVDNWTIIKKHLIPNAFPIVIVGITFSIPGFIFSEAFLSYLGIGLQAPNTSWGIMASEATSNVFYFPHQMFFPSLMIALTMLGFTLLGDGLRDALDPKLRK